ncbi:type III-D CRISPR-associated protein Csx19 [Lachnoanaerobaculum sp. OBRC5-5]|uniref:type III-D CRISPR-associated protein Csx19 n=1 Tax=Lachnoanaerobaculum sp. OBRC5-5 TaxID=936595 RepID=UPI000282511C|nr:CRISPR-associated protein Csx19 [Lachnoanaerobaculum sp. OBRC5-5]EJZ68969.1 tigr03984 family CRISPR-associated protein [Lachnoanaerobaculum sp. OBRC5-5]
MEQYREFKNILASRTVLTPINEDSLEEMADKIKSYDYKLIYYRDGVQIKKKEDFVLDSSVLEIRAFNALGELHLLKKGLKYIGRIIEDNTGEGYEIIDDLYKVWGQLNSNDKTILSEDRGIRIMLPFEMEKGKLLFAKVRHYFSAKGELKNLDWRLVGFEEKDERIFKEVS